MGQKEVSRGTVAAVVVLAVSLVGGGIWFAGRPKASHAAYSDAVSERERSPEFARSMEKHNEYVEKNPEALSAQRELTRDRDYQPERD